MSSRPRPTSQLPKAPTSLSPTAVIADSATLTGIHLITIGPNVIIHPRARLNSTYAPITISASCIVSEKCSVGLLSAPSSAEEDDSKTGVTLDPFVMLEPGCVVEATRIGAGSVVDVGAKISAGATLGEHCRVAPLCTVPRGEALESFTVVFGNGQRRRERKGLEGLRRGTHEKQVDVLRRLVPSNLAKFQHGSGG